MIEALTAPVYTASRELDEAVEVVLAHRDDWVKTPVARRIALLRECVDGYLRTAEQVVAAGCEAKGIDPASAMSGEEWMSGPVPVIRQVRLFIESLSDIQRARVPRLRDGAVHRVPTGELAVTVFPGTALDRAMYPGTHIDVWMDPVITEESLQESMAVDYRTGGAFRGQVAAVLGAGNVASIAPTDVLHKLLVENAVVVLKMHPVNAYLGPLLERAFQSLVAAGFLRIVYGDVEEGQHLVHHPAVDTVHMTGSTLVHDRIVWGDSPDEQARRRAAGTPKLDKDVTSELGCVTPTLVVPGCWSEAELQYQAENVATMVAHSASCTCTSAKLIVTWRAWPQRQEFLDRIAAVLASYKPRLAYYPGSARRYERFVGSHPQARRLTSATTNMLSCATIYDVDPAVESDVVFREEAWSPVLVECSLDGASEAEFIDGAVRFCNERVFGTLSMSVILQPASYTRLRESVDRAVAALRYGTVSINHWSAVSFGLAVAPWGAYPGHTLENIGSGIGFVHNTLMFERPLKSVVWGPFTVWPKPPWFITHRRAHIVGRRMARFEAAPSPWRLPGIAVPAIRP